MSNNKDGEFFIIIMIVVLVGTVLAWLLNKNTIEYYQATGKILGG